jgi:hypothetical protein
MVNRDGPHVFRDLGGVKACFERLSLMTDYACLQHTNVIRPQGIVRFLLPVPKIFERGIGRILG